jgi:hypothetical protein
MLSPPSLGDKKWGSRQGGESTVLRDSSVGAGPDLDTLLRNGDLAPQGKVHLLLAAYPLVKIERIYQSVFKNILNEEVSTSPVIEATPQDRRRRLRGPTPEEIRGHAQEDRLRRARNNPPRQEILSAKSLNVLLVDLQQLEDRNIHGPDSPLTAELLQQINVTTGRSPAHVWLLKQERFSWPLALRASAYDNDRQFINSLVAKALRGEVDSASVKAMVEAVENLEAGLALIVKDLPARQYVEARRFLRCLKEELEVLQLPDASLYVNGTYAARGKSVQELIRHMSAHSLRFGPDTTGNEAAYLALHRALVAYDLKAHAAANQLIIDPIEPITAE